MKRISILVYLIFLSSCSNIPNKTSKNEFEVNDIEISFEKTPDTCSEWQADRDKYMCVIQENKHKLLKIYGDYKLENPEVSGGILLEIDIEKRGTLNSVSLHDKHSEVAGDMLRDEKLISKLINEIENIKFVELSKRTKYTLLMTFSEYSN